MKELKLLPLLLAIVLLAACSKTVMQNETAADQQPEPAVQAQPEPQERAAAAEPQVVSADPKGREMFLNNNIYSTALSSNPMPSLCCRSKPSG